MSPTDHVRTLRDYAKRSIAYGFEETFDPDDADDIADYIEKLEAENAELQSKINTVKLAAKYAAKIRDARIEHLDASSEGWKEIADEYFDAICERNTRIEKLEAALRGLINANENGWHPMKMSGAEWFTARQALEGKDD